MSDLRGLLSLYPGLPWMVLGGGSNVLFVQDFPGLVVRNALMGKRITSEEGQEAVVQVGAGEPWHDLVLWCVAQGLGGLENLSLIPGTVGAAPIQNIGAYGVELKDVFHQLEALDTHTGECLLFDAAACRFGYRDSVFKHSPGRFVITRVWLRLARAPHRLHLGYGAIRDTLAAMQVSEPSIQDVSEAVMAIRRSKLPDPAVLGNAGSFFKNPEMPQAQFAALQAAHPRIVAFPLPDGQVKVPAGWLIEQCGWKGRSVGRVGCYEQQALVLVNHGGATGQEVQALVHDIIDSVQERFGVVLVPEVNMV